MEENNNIENVGEKKEEIQKVEVVKKKNSVLTIILVIILMAGCLVGGYFINEAGLLSFTDEKEEKEPKKETKKEEKKEPVVTTYAVTDEKVAKLIDNLITGTAKCSFLDQLATGSKVEVSVFNNPRAFEIAQANGLKDKDSYTLDEVTKEIQKYLGKDYQFDPTSISDQTTTCPRFKYDSTTKTFNKQVTACGWTCGPTTDYKLIKAVDTDGILKLDVKVIFSDASSDDKYGYYSDYQKTNKIGTFEDNREALYDKGSNYQFTFKLEDGNYVFVSSEPIK